MTETEASILNFLGDCAFPLVTSIAVAGAPSHPCVPSLLQCFSCQKWLLQTRSGDFHQRIWRFGVRDREWVLLGGRKVWSLSLLWVDLVDMSSCVTAFRIAAPSLDGGFQKWGRRHLLWGRQMGLSTFSSCLVRFGFLQQSEQHQHRRLIFSGKGSSGCRGCLWWPDL